MTKTISTSWLRMNNNDDIVCHAAVLNTCLYHETLLTKLFILSDRKKGTKSDYILM